MAIKATIGHVHLTVSNLQRSLSFYRDLLGFDVVSWYRDDAVFLSSGGYHHHIGLNTWAGKNAPRAPAGHTGLYHYAILFQSKKELAKVVKKLVAANYLMQGISDHGVSRSVYLQDPDGIGIELYYDLPKKDWPRKNGKLSIYTKPISLDKLLG